ncbi:MAG: arginine deiminase family protein [Acidobacteriota bacterium]|nr:arginine deiminase family protein [Acidobacteriota bacterium]
MVRVTSEIGRVRRVLVHEPGIEVDNMVPAMMEELLFDDILYGDRARDEHARFRRVLQLFGIEVLDVNDLLHETLENEPARQALIEVLLEDLPEGYGERLRARDRESLLQVLVGGLQNEFFGHGVDADELFTIPPLPNWCFQRDPQIVLGDGVVFSSMATPARRREAILARAIFRHHPSLCDTPVILDPIARQNVPHAGYGGEHHPHLEGGDVLVLSKEVVAVGISVRTNRVGVNQLARALARLEDGPRWMVLVRLPSRRAYMHLDTVFTPIDKDACLAFAPVIRPGGAEEARVSTIDLRSQELTPTPSADLLTTLKGYGIDLQPITCGAEDYVAQQREQWTDGANAFALAPGVITLFDRNLVTASELERRGFRLVEAEDLLLGREEVDLDSGERVCILIRSHEISRARGGPHCLVHPLVRDDL